VAASNPRSRWNVLALTAGLAVAASAHTDSGGLTSPTTSAAPAPDSLPGVAIECTDVRTGAAFAFRAQRVRSSGEIDLTNSRKIATPHQKMNMYTVFGILVGIAVCGSIVALLAAQIYSRFVFDRHMRRYHSQRYQELIGSSPAVFSSWFSSDRSRELAAFRTGVETPSGDATLDAMRRTSCSLWRMPLIGFGFGVLLMVAYAVSAAVGGRRS
jgi:hypothetical protein